MPEDTTPAKGGALQQSLDRNSKTIRKDRAQTISDTARLRYRRAIEDKHLSLRECKSQQDALIDMSPDNTMSIIRVADFDAEEFVKANADLARKIYDLSIVIEVMTADYKRLFGEDIVVAI